MNENGLRCDDIVAGFVIERYAAGNLPEPETIGFEEHLLTCDRCQNELALAIAVREALPEVEAESGGAPSEGGGPSPAQPYRLPWRGIVAVTLAAAAIATVLLMPRQRVSDELAELGRVTQPPVYLGVPVRQAPARPDSVFGAAMADYMAGELEAAVVGLAAALTAGIEPAPAEFFRGASLLMLDRPEEATGAFDAVIAEGESPYLAEAHFYRAKALLRLGRAADAQNSLEASAAVAGRGSAVAASARALSDSLEALVGG